MTDMERPHDEPQKERVKEDGQEEKFVLAVEHGIRRVMKRGKIPGLCIVVVREGQDDIVRTYGCADVESKTPVTPTTLFELASCSKSFTALALVQLEEQGLVNLDDPVSKFFPRFYVSYNGKEYPLTIRQLLHHTGGIPWQSISRIPRGNRKDALEKTLERIRGIELNAVPGRVFEYSTVNYDIIGAIIEKASGMCFEDYLWDNVLRPLELNDTRVGVGEDMPGKASGYKTGLLKPGKYRPPLSRGNNPAAYVVSNGLDMARWLKFHMGLADSPLTTLAAKTHKPYKKKLLGYAYDFYYAMGWLVDRDEQGEIFHTGLNPTFTSYMGFLPREKIGLAVLANSNSFYTLLIAEYVMALFSGKRRRRSFLMQYLPGRYSPFVSGLLVFYLAFILDYLAGLLPDIFMGLRPYVPPTGEKTALLTLVLSGLVGLGAAVFLFPGTVLKVPWRTLLVWASKSFLPAVILFATSLALTVVLVLLLVLFPL